MTKPSVELETVLSHLKLKTIDETQAAFAVCDIHISESTAFKWREMAKENPTQELPRTYCNDQNPTPVAPEIKTTCFKRLVQSCAGMFGK